MLDAAREQIGHRRGPLEDRAHPVRDGIGVAVGPARRGQLLELVEEQDQPPPVRARHALGQLEGEVERSLRVLGREARA